MPPINNLLRQLLNDERIIQKLQDSKPIREAAKATVAALQKGKEHVEDLLEQIKNSETCKRMEDTSYKETTYEQWKKKTADDLLKNSEEKKKD